MYSIHNTIFIRFSWEFETIVANLFQSETEKLGVKRQFFRNLGKNLILKNSPILLQVSDL